MYKNQNLIQTEIIQIQTENYEYTQSLSSQVFADQIAELFFDAVEKKKN
jgi:hypothetical protein